MITQADVDRLERAAASGELSVEYDGKKVQLRSAQELLQLIAYAKRQLAGDEAAIDPARRRVSLAAHSRG